ncbi:hypothetical protein T069G_08116 [Trichoderma breve]|uniref:Uncharacterized protein n=1 Tax=Trichoderma breve TaxID=2034170 RepID=A0A9W9B768_9HYPO|nr:hypothetical protein T069G_08116 [Trichoderma breve]KAJ4857219.1 hypothetical protein T069G_08116 [Trichoderma breve]
MEPYDPTQHIHVQKLHTTHTAKHNLDLDEFDDSGHVASKRACLQPQYSLSESSLLSAGFQTYTIDPNVYINFDLNVDINFDLNIAPNFDLNIGANFDPNIDPNFDINISVETAEVTDISSFEDQMDTGSDATLCSIQEDIMSST